MPQTPDEVHAIARVEVAFGDVAKPKHFTDFNHCCECREHDELLAAHDRNTIGMAELGNAGWDPLCFASDVGKAYYMPALARLALAPVDPERGWYGEQLLFHLSSGGPHNSFFLYCNPTQRAAVAALLAHIIESRASSPELQMRQDEWLRAHDLWSTTPE